MKQISNFKNIGACRKNTLKRTGRKSAARLAIVLLLVLVIITQTGCQKKKDPTPLWDEGTYMGTVCRITLYATDDELKMSVAKPILNDAFELIKRFERSLSRDKEGSDIWRVNNGQGQPIECDNDTVDLLWEAMTYSDISEGAFDVTMGPLMDLWNFDSESANRVPTSAELSRALKHVGYGNIQIDDNKVTLLDPEAKIDLSDIAKGFIAEKVGAYLRTRGVTGAVIDFGGTIEVVGYKAGWVPLYSEVEEKGDVDGDGEEETMGGIAGGTPFVIGIKDPKSTDGEFIGTLTTGNRAIVTAGLYDKSFEANGKMYHSILSSKTGYPVNTDLLSATVVGPTNTASTCDALSTICLAKGLEGAKTVMAKYPEYGAILIDAEGEITTLGNLPEFKLAGSGEAVDLTEEGIKVD